MVKLWSGNQDMLALCINNKNCTINHLQQYVAPAGR
jgi:hypothetical protein